MKPQESLPREFDRKPSSAVGRWVDLIVFIGFLLLSIVVLSALAIAAPVILAASAIIGVFMKNDRDANWRSASA